MECSNSTRAVSALLDPPASVEESRELDQHVQSCPSCTEAVLDHRRVSQMLAALPTAAPPPDLTAALQVIASHERARRIAHLSWRSYFTSVRERAQLAFKNLMRPLALPVAGGVCSAVLLFGTLVPDLTYEMHPVLSDVPTMLSTGASVKDVYWPVIGEAEIVVDVQVDGQGRMLDYAVVCGPALKDLSVRRRFESALLLTQFTPGTTFGKPTMSTIRVSYRTSRIDIRG